MPGPCRESSVGALAGPVQPNPEPGDRLGHRPNGHHYRYLEIELFIALVLSANVSFRGAAKSLQLYLGMLGGLIGAPTSNCGRLWLMRLGLYELTRPLPVADDWIWIVDHTVQIGTQKCFVIAGVRLSQLEWLTPELTQLSIVAIDPVDESNADIVEQQLTAAVQRTGAPREIVSDGCRELKRGIAQFLESHPGTVAAYDVKHKAALILKKSLESDDRWQEFNKAVNKTRQATLPSRFAYLAPPTPKAKARYMNMQPLIRWSQQMHIYLSDPFPPTEGESFDVGPINIHFKWLLDYQDDIAEWARQIDILETATEHCRRHGYQHNTATTLSATLQALAKGERSKRVADQVLAFLEEQSDLANEGERLVATSECIESLFSKGKQLEQQQSSSGFTTLVLALAAWVVPRTRQFIANALATVKTRDVYNWAKAKIGTTVQAKRKRTLGKVLSRTKTAQKHLAPEP